jgi:Fe2+ or Zn2+ uptake regulation protein
MTQQRRAILRVMETASKHLDAAQLLRKAQKRMPGWIAARCTERCNC